MSRRQDLISAAGWAAIGGVIVVASWRLDRLEKLNINPWSAPGLTPGVVGALIICIAIGLALQAWRATASPETAEAAPEEAAGGGLRTLVAAALCVTFAGITLGHGAPFVIEGAVFIFAFTSVFSWSTWRDQARVGRALAQTAVIAAGASAFISWLFESVFLVRLP